MHEAADQTMPQPMFYTLKSINYDVKSSEWQEGHKTMNDYTILAITEGNGRLHINEEIYKLERGKCYILLPGMAISLETGENGLGLYKLTFSVMTLDKAFSPKDSAISLIPCQKEVLCKPFSTCADLLQAIYQHRNDRDEIEIFHNHVRFQELLLFILKQNALLNHDMDIRQSVKHSMEYISQHYQNILTVEELASMANIDRWRYTRIFKELTGQVPLQYLNEIRINKSKELLLLTNDRLYNIAQQVGFTNEYYFSRRFKQTVGVSPKQYRWNHQQDIRVFAPYLEDFLLALDTIPVVQSSHVRWGKQDYLALHQVPTFDVTAGDFSVLSRNKPDFIVIDQGMERWVPLDRFKQLAPTYKLSHAGEEWKSTLRTIADHIGKIDKAENVIQQYEWKAKEAKRVLRQTVGKQTVACLRISTRGILLYAGPDYGYTGPVLYRDLGLNPHPLVQQLPDCTRFVCLTSDELSRLDADHLFITFDTSEGDAGEVLNDPVWRSLPAVRNHCVYEVDFFSWMNYGVLSNSKKIDDVLKVLV